MSLVIEYSLPKNKISNQDLETEMPDFDKKKFDEKIGINSRYVSNPDESSLELAVDACEKLKRDFNFDKIDLLIVCTQTPKHILPGNASFLQNALGLKNIAAFDINIGCSGFIYNLHIANSFIKSGLHKNVLLVNTDTYSKYIHPRDKANRGIFGDAASACILTADRHSLLIGNTILGTDGSGSKDLFIENGGGYKPYDNLAEEKEYGDNNKFDSNHIYMNGPAIFNFTINKIPSLVSQTLESNNLKIQDIDFFIFHQANSFMLNYLRRKIKIPNEKFLVHMKKTGNTVSCTIPIVLNHYIEKGIIKQGDKVMLVGFGVGLSWGATILYF